MKNFFIWLISLSVIVIFIGCDPAMNNDQESGTETVRVDPIARFNFPTIPAETPIPILPTLITPTLIPTLRPTPEPLNWTVMVYLDGDNNLESAAIEDLNEMESINLSDNKIKVITLLDRINGYDTSNGDWTNTRLYEINCDPAGVNTNIVSTRLASTELGLTETGNEELNMGNASTLSNFIDFCQKRYPADNYFLILWNHGNGWRSVNENDIVKAVCLDDSNNGDCLFMNEVQTAISYKDLDVIGFDACFMGMIEVAYEIRNDAKYMIGSEYAEPNDGWEYNYWLNTFRISNQTPVNLCNSVIDAYQARYINTPETTLSAIDLGEVHNVYNELNNFSSTLSNSLATDTIRNTVLNNILTDVEDFWYGNGYDYNIDLWHLADRIQNNFNYCDVECINLKNAIQNAVIDEWNNSNGHPDSHGMAIHLIGTTLAGNYFMSFNYCNGYNSLNPVEFVQDAHNNWVAHYLDGNAVGPGLLYRLWFEIYP